MSLQILTLFKYINFNSLDYGTLRLSNVTGGYLEVYLGYDWGYVCFDSYYYYYYYYYRAYNEEHLADLACRQIGYLKATSFKTEYLASSTPVPSLNIGECSETETNVTMCDYSYLGDYCYFRFSLECQTGKLESNNYMSYRI